LGKVGKASEAPKRSERNRKNGRGKEWAALTQPGLPAFHGLNFSSQRGQWVRLSPIVQPHALQQFFGLKIFRSS
jgi:hypothetical protein